MKMKLLSHYSSIVFLLLFLGLTPPKSGFGNDQNLRDSIESASLNTERLLVQILSSVRKIVEKRLGGEEGLQIASQIIKETREKKLQGDKEGLSQIRDEAKAAVRKLSSAPMSIAQQIDFLERDASISHQSRSTLLTFANPLVTCKKIGGTVASTLILFFGFSGKVDLAYCTATNGRKWIEIGMGAGIGWVLGAVGSVNVGKREYSAQRRVLGVLNLNRYDEEQIAFFLGVQSEQLEEVTEWKDFFDLPDLSLKNIRGLSCGSLLSFTRGLQVNVKVIPLGTDSSVLLSKFSS